MHKYLYPLILLFILNSCETREELASKKLIGQWAIHDMSYNGKNCKDDLLINYLIFQKKGFLIPEIYNYSAEDENDDNEWELKFDNQNRANLSLKCHNKVFEGTYEIVFFKDYKAKLLGIKLRSKKTSIIAYKWLQKFDSYRNWDTEY